MMLKLRVIAVIAAVSLSAVLVTAAAQRVTSPAGAATANFKHIIVIVQENRTPDNLFHGLCVKPYGAASNCSTTPSAQQYDIQTSAWLNKDAPGGTIEPKAVTLARTADLDHSHKGFLAQCDLKPGTTICRMDGRSGCKQCPENAQWNYVGNANGVLNPYLELATQY